MANHAGDQRRSSPMTLLASEFQKTSAAPRQSGRIDALDWVKGALILSMVAYHAINYSAFRPIAFQYLAFLPPSFILITGFLVGQVYAGKYDLGTFKPYLRLFIRGAKLFLLFAGINLGHYVFSHAGFHQGLREFAARSGAIFLAGSGRNAIFEILLPIAYFLLLAPILLWLRSWKSGLIAGIAGALFLICTALELKGLSSKNLGLFSAGVIGMALGLARLEGIDRVAAKWLPGLLTYVLYRVCSRVFGEWYPIQVFGATASIFILYSCALHLNCGSWSMRQIIILGRYSLLAYLAQIAILQMLVKLCGGRPDHWAGVLVFGVATTAILFVIVRLVHAQRQRLPVVDLFYKAVFA